MHSERSIKDFLLGVFIGGSAGALLFNTERGKKVQKDILSKYRQMRRKAENYIKAEMKKRTAAPRAAKKRKRRHK
jgi:gas vesicle protein